MGHLPHVRGRRPSVRSDQMDRYLIERTLPGAGRLSPDELQAIAQKSVGVLAGMAPRAQWVQSYVTDDAIICVYLAEDEATLLEHGRCGGFPVDSVRRVRAVIDPIDGGGLTMRRSMRSGPGSPPRRSPRPSASAPASRPG